MTRFNSDDTIIMGAILFSPRAAELHAFFFRIFQNLSARVFYSALLFELFKKLFQMYSFLTRKFVLRFAIILLRHGVNRMKLWRIIKNAVRPLANFGRTATVFFPNLSQERFLQCLFSSDYK